MNTKSGFLPRARRSWVGALFALGLTASLNAAGPLSAWRGHPAYELYRAIGVGDSNTFLRLLTADTNLIHQPLVTDQLPLYQAAERGRLFMVEWLLAHGADPNAVRDQQSPHDQLTPLRGAAGHGHFEICKRLLQAGAAVDRRQTTVQGSPLYFAIGAQSEEIAALLLDHGANPFHAIKQTLSAPTPIELAILRANGLLVPRMLAEADSGAKAKFLARRGPALLRAAAVRGQLAAVKALLAEGISPEMADRNEAESSLLQAIASWTATALHQASDSPQPALLERARRWTELRDLLIQHGAKYDVFAATGMGDEQTVRRWLAKNPDRPRVRDAAGNTPLHWSVRADWPRLTTFWLRNGAVPAATNRAGQTPLHLAVRSLLTEQVTLLLAAGSPTDLPDTNGVTAFEAALRSQRPDVIRLFLQHDPARAPSLRGVTTALHEAAVRGTPDDLAAAFAPALLEAPDELGRTAFQLAVLRGRPRNALWLRKHGADVNARDAEGNSALPLILRDAPLPWREPVPTWWLFRLAQNPAQTNCLRMLAPHQSYPQDPRLTATAFLLALGADATATNQAGESVLQLAIKTSRTSVEDQRPKLLRLLVAHGADLNERDARGETALHRAAREMTSDRLILLLAAGADLNATNNLGRTPLHAAVEVLDMWPRPLLPLLKARPDVNARDRDGLTPLHLVFLSKGRNASFRHKAVEALLKAGAAPNVRDHLGRSPLLFLFTQSLRWHEVDEEAELLLEAGADAYATDAQGRSVLHYLAQTPADFGFFLPDIFSPTERARFPNFEPPPPSTLAKTFTQLDPNLRDQEGNTPMHLAAAHGNWNVFSWLRRIGGRVDLPDANGDTALWLAYRQTGGKNLPFPSSLNPYFLAEFGALEEIQRLLQLEPRLLNLTNYQGNTPLRLAAYQKQTAIVDWLDAQGAVWDAPAAVMAGNVRALREILARNPKALHEQFQGNGLLPLAVERGHQSVVECLLVAGADWRIPAPGGRSPMAIAKSKGYENLVELLRQTGAQEQFLDGVFLNHPATVAGWLIRQPDLRDATNAFGLPPIHLAAALGHREVLDTLLKAGASPTQPALRTRSTPLDAAALSGQIRTAALLLARGADVETYNGEGWTPLHLAAAYGQAEMVQFLLDAGAHPDTLTHSPPLRRLPSTSSRFTGSTALHLAAMRCQTNVMQRLLRAGANPQTANSSGLTPRQLVSQGMRLWEKLGSDQFAGLLLHLRLRISGIPVPSRRSGDPLQRPECRVATALLKAAGAAEETQ